MKRRTALAAVTSAVALLGLAGCGGGGGSWSSPNANLSSTRDLASTGIDRANTAALRVAWRFRLSRKLANESGAITATPVVANGIVYLQDMKSNVWALDLATGKLRWRRLFDDDNPGPDGLVVADGLVFGTTDAAAFALDAKTGRILWRHELVTVTARFVEIAPQVADGLVFVSTIGLPPKGRGILWALDEQTGRTRWRFDTIEGNWKAPWQAGGGGAWYPPSVGGGQVFWGTTNPYPYGGSPGYPNGAAYAGAALYTDSLLVLDAKTGKLDWYDQVTPHDIRDYDFEDPAILSGNVAYGAGKAGYVIAWNRSTHAQLWKTALGTRRNDTGPLPAHRVSVCPGLLGGVETPMASDGSQLYVPVVDLCMWASATGYENLAKVNVPKRGKGELVALDASTGRRVWTLRLPQADFGCATVAKGVVFTSTFDGTVYGVDTADGSVLWKTRAPAGINSCPALAGNTLLVGSGVLLAKGDVPELTAYRPAGRS